MAVYRDDREVLRSRITELEDALRRSTDRHDRERLAAQVEALAARVQEAASQVEQDRSALADIAASVERMKLELAPEPPPAQPGAGQVQQSPAPQDTKSRAAFYIAAAGVAIALVVALAVVDRTQGKQAAGPAAPTIPGFPHQVDPSAVLAQARSATRFGARARLTRMRFEYVSSQGRIDLDQKDYQGSMTFEFIGPEPPPAPPSSAPIGAPKPFTPMAEDASVLVNKAGIQASSMFMASMNRRPVPEPRCNAAQVWAAAQRNGAPGDAVAILEYGSKLTTFSKEGSFRLREGPVWSFEISGTTTNLTYVEAAEDSCVLELVK